MARERENWQREDKRDFGSDDLGYSNEDNHETWRSQGRTGGDFQGGGRWRGGQQGQRYGEERYGQGGQYSHYGQGRGAMDPYRQGQGHEGGYQGGEQGDWRSAGSQGWSSGERGYAGSRGGYQSGGQGSRYGMGEGGGYGQGYGQRRGSQDRDFWDRAGEAVSSWFGGEDSDRNRQYGEHRGKGPRGYTRSDDRIREDVNDRLTDDWAVDASGIEVEVDSCEVTLTGEVPSREMKRRAEDVAEAVSGVKHVQNNLRVNQSGQSGQAGTTGGTGTGTTNL
jgi:osmotically-inducible protein OsmY